MNRKPESQLPMLPSAKPPAKPLPPKCDANDGCRFPGITSPHREGLTEYTPETRFCVEHLYIAIDRNRHAINR